MADKGVQRTKRRKDFMKPVRHALFGAGSMELDAFEPTLRRAPSPAPSVDFSIIDVDPDDPDVHFSTNASIPGGYPTRRSRHWSGHARSFSTSAAGMNLSRSYTHDHARVSSEYTPVEFPAEFEGHRPSTPPRHGISLQTTFKALLPRIWDAISSPGRAVLNFSPSAEISSHTFSGSSSSSSSRSTSPSPQRSVTPISQSWYHTPGPESERRTPIIWNLSQHKSKVKSRTTGFFSRNGSQRDLSELIDYSDLLPLDGEEGELIDDEACFIDVRAVTGIDILALLPPELALHTLTLLCPPPLDYSSTSSSSHPGGKSAETRNSPTKQSSSPSTYFGVSARPSGRSSLPLTSADEQEEALHALLACRAVSHTWRRLASDNAVWRALFLGRWGIDLERATPESMLRTAVSRKAMGCTWDYDWGIDYTIPFGEHRSSVSKGKQRAVDPLATPGSRRRDDFRDRSLYFSPHRISYIVNDAANSLSSAPLQLDWRLLYRERLELDMRWSGTVPERMLVRSRQRTTSGYLGLPDECSDLDIHDIKENIPPWEPKLRRMEGHTDSVYCLEFDSQRIMTGSRDRTIKVWSLKTGQVLGTFQGVHTGSVLCLKFERDWDRHGKEARSLSGSLENHKGMLVSGSSDCTICVWDIELGDIVPGTSDREVKAEVRELLKGHEGGVLDIRMDEKWIVSCSKDASIRVWDRNTLESVRILRGHEGPVNAIGLQGDKVVSASGDGKMILWDITNGERIRTFEGHDRGLACIEFKENLIVSGCNDCKIKVWDPWTGDCLRTLVGHDALVRALSFDPRSGRLVSVSYDRTVKVWDLWTGKLIREFKRIHASHIFDVKFDIARIVTTSHDHKIIELDFSAGLDTSLFV
ncbi:nuclear distribution protein nudF [Coprinopsis cinerea okayama7|uniref:Nuclear distribution protein nudF n=1 Tax=Coprinopsis cinerea (strain Okayama-7 / 130 / ATCC MYA-4618 / FGSC 9003) TaxID=240176 RepID=A8NZP3_COPC7|nr:nuclear distribution protein nudF [Coprinopsis cinerea okayama7\|eukprot:XP_001837716.2 nuclear distribution protein nudF [Coprinopsis cinerea okayama7\